MGCSNYLRFVYDNVVACVKACGFSGAAVSSSAFCMIVLCHVYGRCRAEILTGAAVICSAFIC